MAKGSEVMQIVFSMKSRVEIMAMHYCMLELVFFKVLSHTDTVHVAEDASESAFIRYPGADSAVLGRSGVDGMSVLTFPGTGADSADHGRSSSYYYYTDGN